MWIKRRPESSDGQVLWYLGAGTLYLAVVSSTGGANLIDNVMIHSLATTVLYSIHYGDPFISPLFPFYDL
ncbi:hypothetical protein BDQ12DRAFT_687017 [Crucibulum laeve]|uniref:Uncharacterized protein n=1 Tax=Crucibulum laeve TaxID=68775 RepID=A0A5C3LVR0_9AGAR|nr:hypothetical protein BDQ12DRAFT_687017 [Crucibulum laeve]